MPRKSASTEEEIEQEATEVTDSETEDLSRYLAAVLNYLSDDSVEEIDIEYLFDNTAGLREWWDQYRASNRKLIEEEIKESLSELSLEDLESIRAKIKEK
ncbi:hypothetical protein [Halalkalibacter akibai]|uniref:Uncharacterized protein n=1 Tax=Halalkalibacter akibai (strain ATCC 43226 / DSM 21942 / CIP 109018 / JCM 9157 / 1139) TaxID=1236973 RepID=W4QNP9_HALA3|nr:hypothetical protein [Halalkalibacter akibai]GAE33711.1 hypothetical protein JCM9157_732 [Halalkalibacter akibai JCM 9157]